MNQNDRRLFVCYVPGLDRRRIDSSNMPHLSRCLTRFPNVEIHTQPTTELFATLLTGTNPHEHQIWQVRLKDDIRNRALDRVLDRVPDFLMTTWQCFRHLLNREYDLPAMARWRRRQFEMHRLKYSRRHRSADVVREVGGTTSLIGLLGPEAHYQLGRNFREMAGFRRSLPDGRHALQLLEFYAFDLLSHWNLHESDLMNEHLRLVDGFIADLQERSREKGVAMMVLVDHGQEQVHSSIDLKRIIDSAGVPRDDYCYYIEVAAARFWFRTEAARKAIGDALAGLDHIETMHRRELERYDICFEDDRFGELYAFAESGHIFFPHDFHHPLGSIFMSLREPTMRRRIFNPRQRGYHGHLPEHPAERGFLMLLDDGYQARMDRMKLTDFAPTVLSFLGREKPDYMRGRSVFDYGVAKAVP